MGISRRSLRGVLEEISLFFRRGSIFLLPCSSLLTWRPSTFLICWFYYDVALGCCAVGCVLREMTSLQILLSRKRIVCWMASRDACQVQRQATNHYLLWHLKSSGATSNGDCLTPWGTSVIACQINSFAIGRYEVTPLAVVGQIKPCSNLQPERPTSRNYSFCPFV